jgi:hypothetical protein
MAYSAAGLSKVAELGVNGGTLWYYCTLDAAATVDTSGYFTGDAVNMLRVADLILRVTPATGTVAVPLSITTGGIGWHVVMTNDGTTVDVSDTTAIAVTNTD